nr:MAG TPA: hypothetical protein [Caudoviricetes sp.]
MGASPPFALPYPIVPFKPILWFPIRPISAYKSRV